MAQPVITNISPHGGLEGDTVTITGINFEAAQGVGKTSWDTTGTPIDQISVSLWSDTAIITSVPSGIVPEKQGIFVTITNNNGETSDPFYFWMESDDPFSIDIDYQIPGPSSTEDILIENPTLAEAKDINTISNVNNAIVSVLKGIQSFPGRIVNKSEISISDGDTAPDISSGNLFKTSNTLSTSIIEFINSLDGQLIQLRINDNNTILKHNDGGATIPLILIGELDINTASGEIYIFIRIGNAFYHLFDNKNSDYAGFFEQLNVPTISQVKNKKRGIWFDTTNNILYSIVNKDNIIYGVELSPF